MGAGYSHRQSSGWLKLVVLAPVPFLLMLGPAANDSRVLLTLVPVVIVLAGVTLAFTSLTIEVDAAELRWFFGPGVWRKSVARAEIASVAQVKNPWWYGFGIHKTPRGWLYNVGGLDGVEVVLKSGRVFRLGTDEPELLARVLSARATSRSF